jgi:hypothetical protein
MYSKEKHPAVDSYPTRLAAGACTDLDPEIYTNETSPPSHVIIPSIEASYSGAGAGWTLSRGLCLFRSVLYEKNLHFERKKLVVRISTYK